MLRSTFCCFRGIGESSEQRLWRRGIQTWRAFEISIAEYFCAKTAERLRNELRCAQAALAAMQADFFLTRMKGTARARVYPDFRDRIGYLDIETDGLGASARVTTLAIYSRGEVRVYVRDVDLHEAIPALAECGLLVTFNGAAFDLPVLRRHFGMALRQPHLDLMHVLRSAGLSGGLKRIEQRLGWTRQASDGVDGWEAVRLWHRYREHGEYDALRRLMVYNAEDTMVLERLLVHAYNTAVSGFPICMRMDMPAPDLYRERLHAFFDNLTTPTYSGST